MALSSLKRTLCLGMALAFAIAPCTASGAQAAEADGFAYSNVSDEQIAEIVETLEDEPTALSSRAATTPTSIETYSGANRYETSALQAKEWGTSSYIILCSGQQFPDALAASSLAGALNCPILLTPSDALASCTREALTSLGVSKSIIIGGTTAISNNVSNQLASMGIQVVKRLGGANRYLTQTEIFKYGKTQNYWRNDLLVITTGVNDGFGDALSASPVAYIDKAPIFLVPDSGLLIAEQKELLGSASTTFNRTILVGGTARIKAATETYAKSISSQTEWIYGPNRFATSAQLAKRSIELGYMNTNNAAFVSGTTPWDSLGGGALQGRDRSVLLLVADGCASEAISVVKQSGASSIRFFGGSAAVSQATRVEVMEALGISRVSYKTYNITLARMAQLEASKNSAYSVSQFQAYLDPAQVGYGSADFYQFAVLSGGYSGITAAQLDAFIARQCTYQEKNYGVTSKLRGTGKYFVAAAQRYGVNEVYLLSHAALESAWGCSKLAQGSISGYQGYYNFYGIGAYDSDPNNAGAAMAKQQNWNTVERAIDGAASWIAKNYIKPTVASAAVSGNQNTLYRMKWDLNRAVSQGDVWHQYATSPTWPTGIAKVMASCYANAGKNMDATGLFFEIPVYR